VNGDLEGLFDLIEPEPMRNQRLGIDEPFADRTQRPWRPNLALLAGMMDKTGITEL
jgi:hypothetical protein